MKLKIQITHWITGQVLFEYEKESNIIYDGYLGGLIQIRFKLNSLTQGGSV